ncbi:MAG: acyl-CoA thioesterase, partial [Pseudomonadota bacterium]
PAPHRPPLSTARPMPSAAEPHVLLRTVEWGDCDPAGIIYYPTYYRWMDAAGWHLLAALGFDAARMRAEHLTQPLVHAACDFKRSPTFGDRVAIHSQVARVGEKSFTLAHRFVREADGAELAIGHEVRVWCRYEAGPGSPLRGIAVPEALRAAVQRPPAAG